MSTDSTPINSTADGNIHSPPNHQLAWNSHDWCLLAIVIAIACLLCLPGLNLYGLIDPTDALYPETAREMLEKSDWINPYCWYKPFYEKPILIYWLILAAYKTFGVSEWAARLPSALSAILCSASLFTLSRFFMRRRAAVIASIVLLTCPLFSIIAHVALTDMLLCCFLSMSLLCFFRRIHGDKLSTCLLGHVALGLAILTKGPFAVILTVIIMSICLAPINWLAPRLWWRKRGRWLTLATLIGALAIPHRIITDGKPGPDTLIGQILFAGSVLSYLCALEINPKFCLQIWWQRFRQLSPLWGLLIVSLITLPWFIAVTIVSHGEFFKEFFIRQNFGRLAGTVNHQNPFIWYYIPVIAAGCLPWIFCLAFSGRQIGSLVKLRRSADRSQLLARFATGWALVVFILFTVLRTKLPTYVLPMAPPMALLCGLVLDRCLLAANEKALRKLIYLSAALAVGGIVALAFAMNHFSISHATMCAWEWVALAALGLATTAAAYLCSRKLPQNALASLFAGYTILMGITVPVALLFNDVQTQAPLRRLVAANQSKSLSVFLHESPGITFYSKRLVPSIMNEEQYEQFLKTTPAPHYTLAAENLLPMLQVREPHFHIEMQDGRWCLCSLEGETKQ